MPKKYILFSHAGVDFLPMICIMRESKGVQCDILNEQARQFASIPLMIGGQAANVNLQFLHAESKEGLTSRYFCLE